MIAPCERRLLSVRGSLLHRLVNAAALIRTAALFLRLGEARYNIVLPVDREGHLKSSLLRICAARSFF